MATIEMSRAHALSKVDARKKAEEIARGMESKLGIAWKWEGDTLKFDATSGPAKGTKGAIAVTDSNVRIDIDLPMMLRMMKGMIEQRVTDKLKEQFA